MLRLDHPMTEHIIRASGLMGGVMLRGQRMTAAPSPIRAALLAECLPLFEQMRELAATHFARNAVYLQQAIDEFEAGIRAVAALGGGCVRKDDCDGAINCPVCGTEFLQLLVRVVCSNCAELYMAAYDRLDSFAGFGTMAI